MEREFIEFCKNREVIYKFLSAVLRDEVQKELLEKLKDEKV